MARRSKLYRGLSRSAEWGGLPALYLIVIAGAIFAAFYWLGVTPAIITGFVFYTALRLFYEWEPAFFRILFVTLRRTPRTPNRKHHGGDFYSA
ncbi:VirB3 family type IV secretion system protein [uncultured Ruegeria sp.]|uniref:VirB3 family type IV secretion system protein n=1 Tax=uncultured Ruegeria sp. TaxID=259304 RepID=UPI00260EB89A|nr:VirB3 family type IV secretion system protein [uncultured Ruegeria sp.]